MQDFTGMRKGRLLVLERGSSDGKTRKYKVECDCGTVFWISDASLRNNGNSCGCLRKELNTKHGERHTFLYKKWCAMKTRCYNKKDPSHPEHLRVFVLGFGGSQHLSFFEWGDRI